MQEGYLVYGRGELHIAVLLENMRREGYELQVSQPHVIIKEVEW
jgi:GTP-binding protein